MSETYDVVVLGAGSAGTNVAWYARDNDLSVAVVESALVGGECSFWACIPSKALLAPVHAVAAARRLPGAAQAVSGDVDVGAVFERRDELISHLDDSGGADWLESIGATLIRGRGRIVGEREVEVECLGGETQRLQARRAVVVATGSRAARPPVDGLADVETWDNRDATTAKVVPDRLVVLGGGPAGCELAQAFRRLGASEVTILETGDRILSPYDPWVSELITDALQDDGVRVLTGRSAERVSRAGTDGAMTIELDDGTRLSADELLVAAGRTPNTDDIGLETMGLEPGEPLEVDDQLRVPGHDWLHAAGDVNGRAPLTHQGKYQARLIGDIVAGKDRAATADHYAVPQAVFTDPEVASVGSTAQDADADNVKVVTSDLGSVAATNLSGGAGRAQLVIDQERRVVIGATFVGPHVSELLHAATVAVVGAVPIDTLWHAVPAFPTISEVWLRLLEEDRGLI